MYHLLISLKYFHLIIFVCVFTKEKPGILWLFRFFPLFLIWWKFIFPRKKKKWKFAHFTENAKCRFRFLFPYTHIISSKRILLRFFVARSTLFVYLMHKIFSNVVSFFSVSLSHPVEYVEWLNTNIECYMWHHIRMPMPHHPLYKSPHILFFVCIFFSLNYLLLSFVAVVICRTKNGNANEAKVKPVNVGEG